MTIGSPDNRPTASDTPNDPYEGLPKGVVKGWLYGSGGLTGLLLGIVLIMVFNLPYWVLAPSVLLTSLVYGRVAIWDIER